MGLVISIILFIFGVIGFILLKQVKYCKNFSDNSYWLIIDKKKQNGITYYTLESINTGYVIKVNTDIFTHKFKIL